MNHKNTLSSWLDRGRSKEEIMKRFALSEREYTRILECIKDIREQKKQRDIETVKDRIMKEWKIAKEKGEDMIKNGTLTWDSHAEIMRSYERRLQALEVEL